MWHAFTILAVLLVCGWVSVGAQDEPTVQVEQGQLRGREATSVLGKTYYSFQGIPYAKPPVGALRFKDAEPPERWNDVRDSSKEGCICTQFNRKESKYEGCEDCLFLNVYTPELPQKDSKPMPVLFWIHGGGFTSGSGNQNVYGPDFLVAEDVVLVTINYRLSVLGYLYMKSAAPGNAGLKDQVRALRWVRKNIAAFNGDPNKVTIFGESAGGTSVNWHMLSPMSKGLFHGAICESGGILWELQWKPYETSKNLAKAVGCDEGSDKKIVECLRTVDNIELLKAAETKAALPRDRDRMLLYTFTPTVEEKRVFGVETFATATPEELMRHGCQHDVPYMTGFNGEEWMFIVVVNKTIFESEANLRQLDSDWRKYVFPETRIPDDSKKVSEAMDDLRDFFLDGKPLTFENIGEYQDMISDLQNGFSTYYGLEYMSNARKGVVYAYRFIADQDLNFLKNDFNLKNPGAAHADEKGYLFHVSFLPNVSSDNPAYLTRQRMVRLWTNFAKYGEPTPEDDSLIGEKWKPYTTNEKNYLEIGSDVKAGKDLNKERVEFWEKFYKKYGEKGETGGWFLGTCSSPSIFSYIPWILSFIKQLPSSITSYFLNIL